MCATAASATSATTSTSPATAKYTADGRWNRWARTAATTTGRHSIGVCYEGGLDRLGRPKDTRTLAQKGSLLALVRELKRRFPKALAVGHHDLDPMKACPCFDAAKEYRL